MKHFFLIITVLFVSCSSNTAPKLALPEKLPSTWISSQTSLDTFNSEWWQVFDDTTFNKHYDDFKMLSPDLKSVSKQLESSSLLAKINGAILAPNFSIRSDGSQRKQNLSAFGFSPSALGIGTQGQDSSSSESVISFESSNFSANLVMQWEIDIWGKLRNQRKAAFKNFEASYNELSYLQFSLGTRFALSYYDAVEAKMQQSLSEQIYQSLKEVRDVVSERYERGLTSSLDLRLSESALANSELQKINQSIQSVKLLRDLEVILGKYPSSSLVISKTLPLSIPSVPAGIPSELIERRPDVKAAINRMEAASYEHVQSKRNLFPSFSLTATGGTSASDLNNILNGDYSVWNLGANITAPIFQSGRLRNNVKLKNSQLSISEIEAAKTMIRAFSEVEQALFVQNAIKEQLKAVSAAEQQSKAAYLLAFDRYQKGLTDLVTVLNSQNQWRNTQSLQISVQKNQIMSFTNLLLALGGHF